MDLLALSLLIVGAGTFVLGLWLGSERRSRRGEPEGWGIPPLSITELLRKGTFTPRGERLLPVYLIGMVASSALFIVNVLRWQR